MEFPDRITQAEDLLWVELSDFGEYRKNWRTWDKSCPQKVWEAMKIGEAFDF